MQPTDPQCCTCSISIMDHVPSKRRPKKNNKRFHQTTRPHQSCLSEEIICMKCNHPNRVPHLALCAHGNKFTLHFWCIKANLSKINFPVSSFRHNVSVPCYQIFYHFFPIFQQRMASCNNSNLLGTNKSAPDKATLNSQ